MSVPTLRGIIAATVLPMTDSCAIDEDALRSYVRWILDEGVHGLAVNVDTGEGPHLDHGEKLRVLEVVTEIVNGRVPVIAGLGAASTDLAVASARDMKTAGADALLVFPSSVFRGEPLPPEIPVDYHRRVGEEADVPLVLFQLQESLGGVELPIDVLVEVARLPQVVAIKEATFSRERFGATVSALRESDAAITILTGNDNFIHESFRLGADGALIGFGTLAARRQVAMVEALEAGDDGRAAELGERIQRLADVIFAPPIRDYRVRLKEALRMLGIIPTATVRPPLAAVSDGGRERIRTALAEAGLT
jgi:4-hydroxy-tetrahydrodipicolinate synthase